MQYPKNLANIKNKVSKNILVSVDTGVIQGVLQDL